MFYPNSFHPSTSFDWPSFALFADLPLNNLRRSYWHNHQQNSPDHLSTLHPNFGPVEKSFFRITRIILSGYAV